MLKLLAQLEAELQAMYEDHCKYPQLRLGSMQIQRLTRALQILRGTK